MRAARHDDDDDVFYLERLLHLQKKKTETKPKTKKTPKKHGTKCGRNDPGMCKLNFFKVNKRQKNRIVRPKIIHSQKWSCR